MSFRCPSWKRGGEVFVVVAEITGEFGDFEGLAAVVLDVADDVLQDLRPLRFGSVGAVRRGSDS